MLSVEELAQLPPRQYLERFHVEFYLRDVLCLFLARRRGDSRSAPEFISQYLESVLRGEHVVQRGFKYVSSTPLNRRAFVLMLRRGLRGVQDPEATALTPHDFHDLVTPLCQDFPLAVVLEAARHARRADGRRHHLLGEAVPFASSLPDRDGGARGPSDASHCGGAEESSAGCDCPSAPDSSSLLIFASLQRMAEFCLVYSELLGVLKHMFREEGGFWPPRHGSDAEAGPPGGAAAGPGPAGGATRSGLATTREGGPVLWQRQQLVTELRFYSSALGSAALPSERALQRLLLPPASGGSSSSGGAEREELPTVAFGEALAEAAEHFELGLDPYPEDLVPRVDTLSDAMRSVGAAESSAAAPSGARTAAASSDRRRRDRSQKSRCRT